MAKALKSIAIVAGVAALVVVTGGAAAGLGVALGTSVLGVSAGALLAGSALASTAAGLLTKGPKVPTSQTDRLTASIDPRTFRKTVLGSTAFPVDVRYEEWSGNDQEYCDWIVAHASHAVDGLNEIWLNTDLAWTAAGGVTPKFAGYFSVPNIILEGTPANAFTFASGKWNGSARLTGCAYSRLRFKVTGNGKKATSPFSSGIPNRITIIGRGAKLYDPRRDSTVPGGSGPMRHDDQSTWRYTADDGAVIGENLPLHALRIVLGWRIPNPVSGQMKLATGSGVPGRRLNLASWIVSANLADEAVNRSAGGTEPRYHGAGVVSEGDDPQTPLDAICAACCGRFRDTNGKLSFSISHNDLAAAATDDGLNDDDVIGPFTWDPDPSLAGTPNVVRGRYVDATSSSLYQLIDYPEVRLPSPDGQDRIFPLDLGYVESPSHAQRVAKQVLQRKQYQREFTAPFDIRAWKYAVGDVVPFTFATLSFTRKLFRVKEQELGHGGICNMTLTVEHAQIYAFDKDDAAPVVAAEPNVYDATKNPLILAIEDASTTAEWDGVTGVAKPADNATNSADPNSPFGPGSTVGEVQREIDAAKARQDTLENVTIPAVDQAVKDASDRITAARQDAANAVADANARIDAANRVIDGAVRDVAAEVDRAQGADEALTRRIDAIVAEGGYDDTDVRALISSEETVRADDDRALGRRVDTVSASVKNGDDAVRADVKVTTDALARTDVAFAEQARLIEASLGTVDNRIAAKAQEVTTAYADADRALGRRIDSIVAEGGYDDRDVRAEIKRVDDTAIDRDGALGRRVDIVQASFTSGGGNMVPNSDLVTTDGWSTGAHAPGGPLNLFTGLNAAGDPYHPPGENVLSVLQYGPPNGPDGSTYMDWYSPAFPVQPGDFVQFSALVNCHRAEVQVILVFGNLANAFMSAIHSSRAGPINNLGNALSDYARLGVKSVRVPEGAANAYIILRKFDTIGGQTDSYAWFLRPYAGAAREGQTTWNPYSVGRSSPVLLGTVARVKETTDALARADVAFAEQARLIEASLSTVDGRIGASASDVTRAFTNADIALGSRSTALEAAASFASSSAVRNDNFNFWPDGQPNPANWITWSAQGNYRVERLSPGRAGGQYCVRTLNDFANVDSGFYQAIFTAGQGKWVVEVTVDSAANGLSGAGVSLHGIWNLDFCGDPDTNGRIGDSSPGEVRSWSKMFDLNAQDVINVHAMHGWSGFGRTIVPKYMTWHCLRLRPANDGEIKAGKADAALNNPGGVLARLTENAATLADLPNRYAATSRTAALEAQVNFAADSGLQRTINARIEDRATAIADSKTGAVAETVRILRGEYDGTTAEVRDQRGVINGLNGKTAAYVRLIADAGNGRASLSLWSDQYGGAWQLGGNGLIDGNLTINGTVTARAFNGPSMIREGQASWSGNVTPGLGQTVAVGWSLGLPTIPPVGRFIYEYTFAITTNAGQVQYAGQDRNRPVYYHYVEDGGGLLVSATDAQGNVYSPRANSSDRILAASDFAPTFTATVRRGSLNSVEDGGDYVNHYIAATYTLTSISLKVTWVAI